MRATPKWLSAEHKAEIRRLYRIRNELIAATGRLYEVDHVVPIRNKSVCGLHVPWNLAVVQRDLNQKKRNYLVDHASTQERPPLTEVCVP